MAAARKLSRSKKIALIFLAVFVILSAADMTRAPQKQVTVKILLSGIDLYQHHLSPIVPSKCKFTPTCSHYARLAIIKYGAFRGSGLAIWRVLRCSPFTTKRGEDYP